MEEDIKILEEFKKNGYSILFMKYQDRNITNSHIERALENLLTRYKKLEQENNNFKEASIINDSLYKEVCNKNKELEEENNQYKKYAVMMTTEGLIINGVKFSFEDYIPKSLIKEKIEELKKQYEDYSSKWEKSGRDKAHPFYRYLVRIEAEIDILQELLRRRGEIRCVSIAI